MGAWDPASSALPEKVRGSRLQLDAGLLGKHQSDASN